MAFQPPLDRRTSLSANSSVTFHSHLGVLILFSRRKLVNTENTVMPEVSLTSQGGSRSSPREVLRRRGGARSARRFGSNVNRVYPHDKSWVNVAPICSSAQST